jgi:hypothetical protein
MLLLGLATYLPIYLDTYTYPPKILTYLPKVPINILYVIN